MKQMYRYFNTILSKDGWSFPPKIFSVSCPWPWEEEAEVGPWIFWSSVSWSNSWRNGNTEMKNRNYHTFVTHSSKKRTLETHRNPSSIGQIHCFRSRSTFSDLPCYGTLTTGSGKEGSEISLFFCSLRLREFVLRGGSNSHDHLRMSWKKNRFLIRNTKKVTKTN